MTTPLGFYTQLQIDDIVARSGSLATLDTLATAAFSRAPQPLVTYNLPPLGSVSWAQWWAIASTITGDTDAAHQLTLAASLMPPGEQQSAYFDKAEAFIAAWTDKNKGIGGGDSPLSWCETVPGFILADILIGNAWPDRQNFLSWLEAYTIPAADSIKNRTNNWGAWGSFCAILTRGHCGIDTTADVALLKKQITTMIAPTGKLPQEELRTGSVLWYSYYCMVPLTCASRVVKNRGGPNYFTEPDTGPLIAGAIENILAMAENPTPNTGKPPLTGANPWPFDLIDAMAQEFSDDDWRTVCAKFAPISYWSHHTGWNIPTLTALTGL